MVAALRALGFDKVVDTNTAADLCICEEGTELLQRLLEAEEAEENHLGEISEPLPMFTSCCPGWIQLVEKTMPELWPYISSCKSPHMMLGALLKRVTHDVWGGLSPQEIYLCSVMPCVRKKGESMKPEFIIGGVRDVDEVVTTRDLGALLWRAGIDPGDLEESEYDSPLGPGSGAGQLFGVTGGVMEAAVRTVYAVVTEGDTMPRLELEEVRGLEGLKEATVQLKSPTTGKGLNRTLRLAVVSGLNNAKTLIADMRDGKRCYDFVEVMACPGGCIGGGGQPKSKDKEALRKRMEAVYSLDRCAAVRRSHENPAIVEIYDKYLGPNFGSELAVETLHVDHPRAEPGDSEADHPIPVFHPPPPPTVTDPPSVPEEKGEKTEKKDDVPSHNWSRVSKEHCGDSPLDTLDSTLPEAIHSWYDSHEHARKDSGKADVKDDNEAMSPPPPLPPPRLNLTKHECCVCGLQYDDDTLPSNDGSNDAPADA